MEGDLKLEEEFHDNPQDAKSLQLLALVRIQAVG